MKSQNVAIAVEHLSKKYKRGISHPTAILNLFNKSTETFYALKDVNLIIEKGEALGIIGGNGAGKSTFLKILSGITSPSHGMATINGRLSSLLEVGTGFHAELTGRENIFLNGSFLGMSKKEIAAKFDEIVDFSGIADFIDSPVKQYSSGMYVRLAFSVAANLHTEIILLDEILAVGDAQFQQKCFEKIAKLKEEGKTMLFVSHNMSAIRQLCSRSILFNKGSLCADGETNHTINQYMSLISNQKNYAFHGPLSTKIKLNKITINDHNIESNFHVSPNDELKIKFHFSHIIDFSIRITLSLYYDGNRIMTFHDTGFEKIKSKDFNAEFILPRQTLRPGRWMLAVGGHDETMDHWFWNEQADIIEIDEMYSIGYEKINHGVVNINCISKRTES